VRNKRLSAGIDQKITKMISIGATYSDARGDGLLVGHNLNAPVQGIRPDPAFANIIETVSQGRSRVRSLSTYISTSLAPMMPGSTTAGPLLNWRRGLGIYGSFYLGEIENNTDGPFAVPASGSLATEWGPSTSDVRRRMYLSLNTQAIKNLSASIGLQVYGGSPYTIRTGTDDNGDLIFNDRPAGVGRNTVRTAMQWNSDGYFSYTLGIGKRKTPLPPGIMISGGGVGGLTVSSMSQADAPRYRITFTLSAYNLTNHANYVGYSGNMKSRFFLQPTSVEGVRTVNLGVSFMF
jgi:hypothetical protein